MIILTIKLSIDVLYTLKIDWYIIRSYIIYNNYINNKHDHLITWLNITDVNKDLSNSITNPNLMIKLYHNDFNYLIINETFFPF